MHAFSRSPDRQNQPRRARLSATTALAVCGFAVAPLAAHAAPANVDGLWSPVTAWPRIPMHAALLPDGKVATYGATPQGNQGGLDVDVWDPKIGLGDDAHVTLPNGINVDSFCVGQVMGSWNGELLMVGGSTNANDGNTLKAESFSYKTKKLTQLQSVRYPRWYSTTTTLPDGRIIVNGGVVPYSGSQDASTTAELYTPGQGWRTLDGTTQARQNGSDTERRYWFPHVFPTANNKVFVIAGKIMYRLGYDGNGSVGDFQAFNGPNWGGTSTAVLFAPNKVLQFGGGITHNEDTSAPPGSKAASVVDFSTYPYKVTDTGSMAYGRHWVTGTVLPNGEVLATGGAEGNNTLTNVAYAAEIWNPQSGQWRTGASMQVPRLYHSIALLLPDGRVLVGGGGAPGPVNGNNVEIYSPPYLFGTDGNPAQRPVIGTEPGTVRLGQTLQVNATGARPVARFTMVKTGSVTHDFNTDQRFLEVPFRKTGDNYDLTITGNALEATPGYYMLFAINDQGVPSIAKTMRIPSPTADTGDTPPAGQNGETKGITGGGNGTAGSAIAGTPAATSTQIGTAASKVASAADGTTLVINKDTGIVWQYGSDNNWTALGAQKMAEIATGGSGRIYGIGTDGNAYRWNGSTWIGVGPNARTISAASDGTVVVTNPKNEIWVKTADDYTANWTQINGTAAKVVAIAANRFWSVGTDGNVYRYANGGWTQNGTAAADIAASSDGSVAIVNKTTQDLWRKASEDGNWTQAGNKALQVAAPTARWLITVGVDNNIYRFSPADASSGGNVIGNNPAPQWTAIGNAASKAASAADGTALVINVNSGVVWQYKADNDWKALGTQAMAEVATGGSGRIYAVGRDGNAYRWNGTNWVTIGPNARTISAASDGTVVVTNPKNEIWVKTADDYTANWKQINGTAAKVVAIAANRFWSVGTDGNVYRYANGGWTQNGTNVSDIAAASDGSLAVVNKQTQVIWRKASEDGTWTQVNGKALQVSAPTNKWLVVAGTDNMVYRLPSGN